MASLLEYLKRLSRLSVLGLSTALLVLLGFLDYATGSELAIDICYLLPIALATWLTGKWEGRVFCTLGALVWLAADLAAAPVGASAAIHDWNFLVRLGSFLAFSEILWHFRAVQDRREELMQFIVHDMRSPLTNIMSGIQTLRSSTEKELGDKDRTLFQIATDSCDRLLHLIENLLDLGRLEENRMPIQHGPVSVEELGNAALKSVALWAERKSLHLVSKIEGAGPTVWADQGLTLRVLVNLLSNAIQASPMGSTVTLRIAPHPPGMAAFQIIDQGPGIPREWTGRVFDKYGQVEARKAGGAVGFGLGLTFCRHAVEAQAGRIWVTSDKGQGTTVTFTLPAWGETGPGSGK